MKFITGSIILSAFIFSINSCKKDKDPVSTPGPLPVLAVKLSPSYLAASQVDSAFAIWVTGTAQQRVKMEVRNDSLITPLSLLNEGNGELTIHLFTQKKYQNQYLGQWLLRKTVSLQKTKALSYSGPSSFNDADWLPRVKINDGVGHEAIVALRPDDAYFLVKDPGHPVAKLVVERSYWKTIGGVQAVGQKVWECTTGCMGQANEEFFRNFPAMIGTKPWNHISIIILFEINNNGQGWGISLEHDL